MPQEHSPGDTESLDISLEPAEAGAGGERDPRLLLHQAAREAMRAHGQGDLSRERAGVMVGEVVDSPRGPLVLVEAAIAAEHTEAQRGSVTFTHETWEQINREKEARFPQLRVVGWYHTHPGFGIFLSEYDQFIQRHFFDLAWNVAYVLDPISGESGAFGWRQGEIGRLPGYEVYGPAAQEPSAAPVAPARPAAPARSGRGLAWATVGLLALLVGLVTVDLLRPAPPAPAVPPSPPIERPVPPSPPAPPPVAAERYQWHTVQPGETLWGLAERYYGRGAMWGLIAAENGLAGREQALDAGMALRIPLQPAGGDGARGGPPGGRGTGD